jgi:hypothetical protein|tara:strand:- start:497 stop:682 length:186 start_codon:yes stop_codon:yes gene_type:complete
MFKSPGFIFLPFFHRLNKRFMVKPSVAEYSDYKSSSIVALQFSVQLLIPIVLTQSLQRSER